VEELTVNRWFFEEGDAVERGDNLLEVTAEGGTFNVTAPVAGILEEIFFEEGDDVEIGEVVATIQPD
jgi:2-oxoglutarate dehydrogenase E2 component (dihydrolipoamide succinyltransferase)